MEHASSLPFASQINALFEVPFGPLKISLYKNYRLRYKTHGFLTKTSPAPVIEITLYPKNVIERNPHLRAQVMRQPSMTVVGCKKVSDEAMQLIY